MSRDGHGTIPIRECTPGRLVSVSGVIASVCLNPAQSTPSLEIEVADDSGHVTVVWLGRRAIPGIEAGRRIIVRGRLTRATTHPVIYNPTYQLRPREAVGD
jgi:RecG-like helicase